MTPTEQTIIYGWLFLLTLATTALFAGWLQHRGAFDGLTKMFGGVASNLQAAIDALKPAAKPTAKPKRRTSKSDLPIKLVPTTGEIINLLTTPPAEPTRLTIADLTVEQKYDLTTGRRLVEGVSGTGGTKPDGDGGGGEAA